MLRMIDLAPFFFLVSDSGILEEYADEFGVTWLDVGNVKPTVKGTTVGQNLMISTTCETV